MNTEKKDEYRTISNFKLTDKEKRAIDIFVNGAFAVLGMCLLIGIEFNGIELKQIVGLLTFYIGARFFPR